MAGKKSERARIEAWAETLAEPIAKACGVYIYDVEYVKENTDYYLNIYIDKEDGVTIDDCENVSRAMSDALDKEDRISDPYTLVVSSPGLGRTLTKDRHITNSIGEKVEISLFKPLPEVGDKQLEGILADFDGENVTIEWTPAPAAKPKKGKKGKKAGEASEVLTEPASLVIPRKDIAVIRLYLDL